MFKGEYQGGSHVEVLSAQGRDPMAHCKVTGSVSHRYDKRVRGYVHVMEGDSTTTRIRLPGNDRTSLGLVQPFLVLQVSIPAEARFVVELSLQDGKGGRRRVLLSSSVREPSISPLIARVPLITMATEQWLNICFDLPSLVAELFPGHTHKSLESLVVGGSCQLRRVFTMREQPRDCRSSDVVSGGWAGDIPKACQMIIDHTPIPTQVMSSVTSGNQPQTAPAVGRPPATSRTVPGSRQQPPTHVAFGQKVAIPEHILSRQLASSSAGNIRKKERSSSSSVVSSTSRQLSAPSSIRGGVATLEGVGLDRHGQQQTRRTHRETKGRRGKVGEEKREDGAQSGRKPSRDKDHRVGMDSGKEGKDVRIRVRGRKRGERAEGVASSSLERDELLALDVLKIGRVPPQDEERQRSGRSQEVDSGDVDTSVDSVPYGLEPRQNSSTPELGAEFGHQSEENSYLECSMEEEGEEEEGGGEREGEVGGDKVFSYFSPPRSAEIRHTPSAGSRHGTRGIELDCDFLHSTTTNEQGHPHSRAGSVSSFEEVHGEESLLTENDAANRQGHPHAVTSKLNEGLSHDVIGEGHPHDVGDHSGGVPHDVTDDTSDAATPGAGRNETRHALSQTRLSDDYDWRQYASQEDDPLMQSDASLHTRLAQVHPSHTPGHHGNSTSNEIDTSTLSETTTLGGWTTDKVAAHSLLDSLDTRDMGGALSPAVTLSDQPPIPSDSLNQSDEELELMYDPQLRCFYDPKTHKYYELVQ